MDIFNAWLARTASLAVLSTILLSGYPAQAETPREAPKPAFAIHDHWTYRRIDAFTGIEQGRFRSEIAAIYGEQAELADTTLASDASAPQGAPTRRLFDTGTWSPVNPRRVGPYIAYDFPLSPGKTWESEFTRPDGSGPAGSFHNWAKVVGWETVTVPAGTFETLRVVHTERHMAHVSDGVFPENLEDTYWYAPAVKRYVKRELFSRDHKAHLRTHDMEELVEYDVHPPDAATAQTALPLEYPDGSEGITAEAFDRRVSGKTFSGVTASGSRWEMEFRASGVIAWRSDGQAHDGTWRIDGNRMCGSLQGPAGNTCNEFRVMDDSVYYKRPVNGEVVSLRAAQP